MRQSAPRATDYFSIGRPAPHHALSAGGLEPGVNNLGHRRLRLILALSAIAFAVVVGRAVQVQVLESSALAAKAVDQQSSLAAVPGLRGTIFDRNHHPLAQDQPAATVIADQPSVKNKQSRRDRDHRGARVPLPKAHPRHPRLSPERS